MFRRRDHRGPDRVQFNIAVAYERISIGAHQPGLVASLPQRTCTPVGMVDIANITGTAVGATQNELYFRFDATGTNFFFLQGADGNGYCLETSGCTGAGLGEHIWRDQFANIPAETVIHAGNITFGRVVPIPGAVWLFGSGLLGLVGVATRETA